MKKIKAAPATTEATETPKVKAVKAKAVKKAKAPAKKAKAKAKAKKAAPAKAASGRVVVRNWPFPKFKAACGRTAKRTGVAAKAMTDTKLQKLYDEMYSVRAAVATFAKAA